MGGWAPVWRGVWGGGLYDYSHSLSLTHTHTHTHTHTLSLSLSLAAPLLSLDEYFRLKLELAEDSL